MGLPQTLAGIAGFMIFIVVILGLTAPDVFPDQSAEIVSTQQDITNAARQVTNQSTGEQSIASEILGIAGLDGIYNYISNFLYIIGKFIVIFFQYLAMFLGIALILPPEFYVFFGIMGITTIVAIVKLIFLSGD